MKTLYKGSLYRVIHSVEEEAACLAEGWSPEAESGKLYIVHTAIPGPTAEEPKEEPKTEEPKLQEPAAPTVVLVPEDSVHLAGLRLAVKSKSAKLRPPVIIAPQG